MLLRPRTHRATAQMNVSELTAAGIPMSAGVISHEHEKSCG